MFRKARLTMLKLRTGDIKKALASCAAVACLALAACGDQSAEIAKQVRADIIKKYAADPETANLKVGDLSLAHRGGNDYRGIVEVSEGSETAELIVEVTYDGKTFIWQVNP